MNRIFAPVALFSVLLMVAVIMVGLSLRGGDIRDASDITTQRWASLHRLSGISAGLVVLFTNSLAVTYFIGTSRWCKEVVDTYQLDRELALRSARLKRRTFPWAVLSMLTVVGIVALGGASDPAASMQPPPIGNLEGWGVVTWSHIHLAAALLGVGIVAMAYHWEASYIEQNQAVIGDVVAEVARIRRERGLD